MKCINCTKDIDQETEEFDMGIDKRGRTIYLCEECLDYSGKTIEHFERGGK